MFVALLCLTALLSPTFSAEARADGVVRDEAYQLTLAAARSDAGGGADDAMARGTDAPEAGEEVATAAIAPETQGDALENEATDEPAAADTGGTAHVGAAPGRQTDDAQTGLVAGTAATRDEQGLGATATGGRLGAAVSPIWLPCAVGALSLAVAGGIILARRRTTPRVRTSYRRRRHYLA